MLPRRHVLLVLLLLQGAALPLRAQMETASGRDLMEAVYQRHRQFPYVYEEQSMILIDRNGYRETRRLRRYSRVEQDGTVKFLLLFDSPAEVRGVALLAVRDPSGHLHKSVYLPAYGDGLIESSGAGSGDNFLGTDFSVENLTGEALSEHRYVRQRDAKIEGVSYYIVDVYLPGSDPDTGHPVQRHFILQENLFIARTDYYDELGRLKKRQTWHDLKRVNGNMWRASMILMNDIAEHHQTLIKIDRRVFSRDYVPETIFTAEWLHRNRPPEAPEAGGETGGTTTGVQESAEADGGDGP